MSDKIAMKLKWMESSSFPFQRHLSRGGYPIPKGLNYADDWDSNPTKHKRSTEWYERRGDLLTIAKQSKLDGNDLARSSFRRCASGAGQILDKGGRYLGWLGIAYSVSAVANADDGTDAAKEAVKGVPVIGDAAALGEAGLDAVESFLEQDSGIGDRNELLESLME